LQSRLLNSRVIIQAQRQSGACAADWWIADYRQGDWQILKVSTITEQNLNDFVQLATEQNQLL
jgi:hypothetical protein